MLRKLVSTAAVCAALFLADAAQAQVRQVPRTGCAGAAYPTTVGSPALGQGFGVHAVPCRAAQTSFIMIGRTSVNRPIRGCGGACVLYPSPDIVLRGASAWRLVIPNNRSYVGVDFGVQTGCFDATAGCIWLSGALHVAITR